MEGTLVLASNSGSDKWRQVVRVALCAFGVGERMSGGGLQRYGHGHSAPVHCACEGEGRERERAPLTVGPTLEFQTYLKSKIHSKLT
jgi:hypothetical protein